MQHLNKSTASVHTGTTTDPKRESGITTPVYHSTSYGYLDTEKKSYPRYYNVPNQQAVVAKLCALEHGEDGLVFSSGMAAITTTFLAHLKKGDHVVLQGGIYGGTRHMVEKEFPRMGITFSFTASRFIDDFRREIRPETKMIYIETPSNPLLEVTDIEAIAALGQEKGLLTVIDNTFASPINQNPLDWGIDIITHSATKYLGGHSDLSCGAVISSQVLMEPIRHTATSFGGTLNAHDCFMLERSLKTLAIRVERQNQNAMVLAQFLTENPEIDRVFYPGLPDHPDHELAKKQMFDFGAMMAFEVRNRNTVQFQHNLKLIQPAMSLGGLETIVCSPAMTSHEKIGPEGCAAIGISDQLIRLSVGIEDVDDLIQDLQQALESTPELSQVES